jgi:hypothetical protein
MRSGVHEASLSKVGVRMQERRSGSDAGGGDQAVERLADRHSLPAGGAVEARGEGEVLEPLESQNGKSAEMTFHELRFIL